MKDTTVAIEGSMIWILPTFFTFIGFIIGIASSGELRVGVPVTKTCYVTEWKWEKSSNGVRVRVPVKQVCVKGDGE